MPNRVLVALLSTAPMLLLVSPAASNGPTTANETIEPAPDNANRLAYGPGEGWMLRQTLGRANPDRATTRRSLINFGHLTDIHIVDEESPARAEAADGLVPSAYRPQEALSAQVGAAMVARLNGIRSPIDGSAVDNFIVTGDSTDNIQLNEIRDVVDTLNGGSVEPDSGDGTDPNGVCDRRIPGEQGSRYEGVRYDGIRGGEDNWITDVGFYDPDGDNDGPGYSSQEGNNSRPEDQGGRGRAVAARDVPGLLEAAQLPFESPGLGAPWYSAFGNHDGLVLGTLIGPAYPDYMSWLGDWATFAGVNDLAQGCRKWLPGDPLDIPFQPEGHWPSNLPTPMRELIDQVGQVDASSLVAGPLKPLGGWSVVPPDPERRMIDQQEWMAQHFDAQSDGKNSPDGHGFAEADADGDGTPDRTYYSTSPKPGIRYIALDTINRVFLSEGSIRDDQFRWLEGQLQEAQAAGELVIVYGHHTLRTIRNGFDADTADGPYHFGLKGEKGAPEQKQSLESLEELLLQYPNVIAYVSGHEHENDVVPYRSDDEAGRFWEISTAAHIDWPQQSRLIQVFDNCDGTVSIFGTLVDHAGAPNPGESPFLVDSLTGRGDSLALASISRELSWNDWQGSTGEDGKPDARGLYAEYRNVELIVPSPVAPAGVCAQAETSEAGSTSTGQTASEQATTEQAQSGSGSAKQIELALRTTSLSLSEGKAKTLHRKTLAKLVATGFKGYAEQTGGISKIKALLVRKKGKRCYRIDRPDERASCAKTSSQGVKASAGDASLSFTYRPLATLSGARHTASAKRTLKRMGRGEILRKGTYALLFKVYPTQGEARTYAFELKVS